MSKVVVVVEGGVINQVLVDHADTKVLVIDRDSGASKEHLLVDVMGGPAALDAMLQGATAARTDADAVNRAFYEVRHCLEVPAINAELRVQAIDKLVGKDLWVRPDEADRVASFVKRELEAQQLDTLSFHRRMDGSQELFVLVDTGIREQVVAEFFRADDGTWMTRVKGYNDEEDETPAQDAYLPSQRTLFVATVQALEYFDREAVGAFCLY
ncbi:hypothetical protein [Burkholderia cenocepacia]|uniref:hypothetical protein n=1 Tax=Burkholderia cenocepacia TaxID=95486 RepID=UPI00076164EC|nr:hypothetical protein [Burkholderia cenocepacia]KWU26274.1 hypothetical protein AS149_25115 [Burkholderia cenocepacia]